MTKRIKRVRKYISENSLDGIVISSYENYRYFSGFSGSNCRLIVTPDELILITDGRYAIQAKQQTRGFEIIIQKRTGNGLLIDAVKTRGLKRVGYEATITDYEAWRLREDAPQVDWIRLFDFAGALRMIKDPGEIENIRRAVEIADNALDALIPVIRHGMTELDVSAELEYRLALCGSEKPAFEIIVASGERGALPHGTPSGRVLLEDEMITLDFGACYNGYLSDITRTVWLGNPPDRLVEVWNIVYEAQCAAKHAVRPGIRCCDLDDIHRNVLKKYGMQDYIMHSLGHGVGLEIHEEPRISPNSDMQLRENMVITVEPGIYIPGVGGVRTEDTVLVTKDGYEQLTQSKHLIKINAH